MKCKVNNTDLEKGTRIIIIVTDLPLNERQLKRISKRASVALARIGSYLGNGSGDIALVFSTETKIPHYDDEGIINLKIIHENKIDYSNVSRRGLVNID